MNAKERIIVALDVSTLDEVTPLVRALSPYVGCFKVGLELITAVGGPQAVAHVRSLGGEVFFDGKFCDIPNTVAGAVKALGGLGVKMFDVHASCGLESMRAASEHKGAAWALAVTVLTSLDGPSTQRIFGALHPSKVLQFAEEAQSAKMDGIICSPLELELLDSQSELRALKKITPGVRPAWAAANDQKRFMTPAEAIKRGASHLVIGRPITNPPASVGGPENAVKKILAEIEEVTG